MPLDLRLLGLTVTGQPPTTMERDVYLAAFPLGFGGPDPIAHACFYLLGSSGDWISGSVLNVNATEVVGEPLRAETELMKMIRMPMLVRFCPGLSRWSINPGIVDKAIDSAETFKDSPDHAPANAMLEARPRRLGGDCDVQIRDECEYVGL